MYYIDNKSASTFKKDLMIQMSIQRHNFTYKFVMCANANHSLLMLCLHVFIFVVFSLLLCSRLDRVKNEFFAAVVRLICYISSCIARR